MGLKHNEFVVLWTYHQEKPADYEPKTAALLEWDQTLVERYESKLTKYMQEFEVPMTRENKSRIVALAQVSNGSVSGTRLRNASRYYSFVSQLSLDEGMD